jgi:hypothetical protein
MNEMHKVHVWIKKSERPFVAVCSTEVIDELFRIIETGERDFCRLTSNTHEMTFRVSEIVSVVIENE